MKYSMPAANIECPVAQTRFPSTEVTLEQRFPDSRSPFKINFYGGAPCLPYVLQVNGVYE